MEAGQKTTYSGNRADGESTNIYGNVYGDLHLPGRSGGSVSSTSLECLRHLRVTDPREDRARIEQDKDQLLKDCYAWVLDDSSFRQWKTDTDARLLWIKGDPGKGKTMMMMGVIAELSSGDRQKRSMKRMSRFLAKIKPSPVPCLLAYFFCQSTRPELNNAVSVLRGLIYMLVTQREELAQYVQKRYKALGRQLFEGSEAIYALREILSDILNDSTLPTTYLLVDALDECTSGLADLLHLITDDSLAQWSKVKWLVTSRNVSEIERYLQPDSSSMKIGLELNESHVTKAVAAFVNFKVQRLASINRYDSETQTEMQQQLHKKAEGTFLWVSLVCKELERVERYRMREVLRELPPKLDPLYDRMMAHILEQKDTRTVVYCKHVLLSITLAFRPLRLEELTAVAGLPSDQFDNVQEVVDLIRRCGSFLAIREDIVSFIHLSAKDYFITGNAWQVFEGALVDRQAWLTNNLLDAMYSKLQRDICNLQKPGIRIQEAIKRIRESNLSRIAYACEYWIDHLQACAQEYSSILSNNGRIFDFIETHHLHWLESMSLLQKMPELMLALQKLQLMLDVRFQP